MTGQALDDFFFAGFFAAAFFGAFAFEAAGAAAVVAAEVAAELGVNANLVYQNSARVLKEVRSRCLEQYEEAVAE